MLNTLLIVSSSTALLGSKLTYPPNNWARFLSHSQHVRHITVWDEDVLLDPSVFDSVLALGLPERIFPALCSVNLAIHSTQSAKIGPFFVVPTITHVVSTTNYEGRHNNVLPFFQRVAEVCKLEWLNVAKSLVPPQTLELSIIVRRFDSWIQFCLTPSLTPFLTSHLASQGSER